MDAVVQCENLKRTWREDEVEQPQPKRTKIIEDSSPQVFKKAIVSPSLLAWCTSSPLPSPPYVMPATQKSSEPQSAEHNTIKTVTISTRTSEQNNAYRDINEFLHAVHVMRHGNPELRERWWEHQENPADTPYDYQAANAVLRQAFLQRRYFS